jgi:hypothetical protein
LDNALSQLFDLSQAFSVNDYATARPIPARTWNLPIAVIAQSGGYLPGATELVDPNDPTKTRSLVEGEKRY